MQHSKCRLSFIFLALILCLAICFMGLWLPASFMSDQLAERGLSEIYSGLFFTAFSAPCLFLGLLISKFAARCQRKRLIIIGVTLVIIGASGLGAFCYVEDNTLFITGMMSFRFIQGLGSITLRILSGPIGNIYFPKYLNGIFIVFNFTVSITIFLGPIWGSFTVPLDYSAPYFTFSAFCLLIGYPLFIFGLPSEQHVVKMGGKNAKARRLSRMATTGFTSDQNPEAKSHVAALEQPNQIPLEAENASPAVYVDDRDEERKLKLCKVCCMPRVLATLLAFLTGIYSQIYFAGILASRFENLGVPVSQIGIFIGISPIARTLSIVLLIFILRKIFRPPVMFMGQLMCLIGLLFFGPSQMLMLPESVALSSTGYFILGFGNGLVLMPAIPELIHFLSSRRILSPNKAGDVASSLFDLVAGFGDLGGPALGAILTEYIGFRFTTDITFVLMVFATVFFGIWGRGCAQLAEVCRGQKNILKYGSSSSRNLVFSKQKADSIVVAKMHMKKAKEQQHHHQQQSHNGMSGGDGE